LAQVAWTAYSSKQQQSIDLKILSSVVNTQQTSQNWPSMPFQAQVHLSIFDIYIQTRHDHSTQLNPAQ